MTRFRARRSPSAHVRAGRSPGPAGSSPRGRGSATSSGFPTISRPTDAHLRPTGGGPESPLGAATLGRAPSPGHTGLTGLHSGPVVEGSVRRSPRRTPVAEAGSNPGGGQMRLLTRRLAAMTVGLVTAFAGLGFTAAPAAAEPATIAGTVLAADTGQPPT